MLCVANARHLVGARGHRRAAVENVDVIFKGEALILQHPHRGAPGGVRNADHRARGFGQHRDIDRMLGHQVGDELVAMDRVELVGFLKAHPEKLARDPVPEGRTARLVDHPAQLGQDTVGEARPVAGDEKIARAREQQPQPAGARRRVQE